MGLNHRRDLRRLEPPRARAGDLPPRRQLRPGPLPGHRRRAGPARIVRPGPYICSEWDLGGLPSWLLRDPAMRLRCSHPAYLQAVDRFFDAPCPPRPAPGQPRRPHPGMQVENEYGSYGNDRAYLRYLAEGMRARGIDVLLFTSDGPRDATLQAGTLPGILKTVNFAHGVETALAKLREHQLDGRSCHRVLGRLV